MEHVIIGAAVWLGASILAGAGWTVLHTNSRRLRDAEDEFALATDALHLLDSWPDSTPHAAPEAAPAGLARRIA